MKKILKSIIATLALTMLLGTTCFAAETSPQIYVDGYTIDQFAAILCQQYEEEKAAKPAGTYSYYCNVVGNCVTTVELEVSNNVYNATVSTIIFDHIYGTAHTNVYSVINGIPFNSTEDYPMDIEIK